MFNRLLITLVISLIATSQAFANLLISPTRVVFDERDRAATVSVINNSDSTRTYRFGMIEHRQMPDGSYKRIDEQNPDTTGLYFASDMIRFSPRQVVLKPGERQQVRLSLRKPADLASGEYRSHLSFVELPDAAIFEQNPDSAQIKLFMMMGFTIPVQVRQGAVSVSASINDAKLVQDEGKNVGLQVDISREGNFSSFGKVTVLWRPTLNAPYEELNFINNVAIYREINQRSIFIGLKKNQLKPGLYKVVYEGDNEFNKRVFDELEIDYRQNMPTF